MKGNVKRVLTVCLFAGVLGSYSSMAGSAYNSIGNYQYVFSKDDDDTEKPKSGVLSVTVKVIKGAVIGATAVTAVGAGIDIYKNGGYKGSKTEEFIGKAGELAKGTYFVPKEWIASKVLPKIEGNEDFSKTKEYLNIKSSSDATFVGEVKGLSNVIKELGVHIWHLIKGK